LLDLGRGALSATVFCGGWTLSSAVAVFREKLSWCTLFSAIIYWARALPGAVFREELSWCTFSAIIYWARALPGAVLGEKLCWCTLFTPVFCGGLALLRAAALAIFLDGSHRCKLSAGVIGSLGIIFWWDICGVVVCISHSLS
jgi:hypothetical protein